MNPAVVFFAGVDAIIVTLTIKWIFVDPVRRLMREARFMVNAHVIEGIFLPAPTDERWQYNSEEKDITLDSIKIRDGYPYFTLTIVDKSISLPKHQYDLRRPAGLLGLSAYCSYTYEHQEKRWREIDRQRQMEELAEASEKHVGLLP